MSDFNLLGGWAYYFGQDLVTSINLGQGAGKPSSGIGPSRPSDSAALYLLVKVRLHFGVFDGWYLSESVLVSGSCLHEIAVE